MATTVWLDEATHGRLVRLREERGHASLAAVIQELLGRPADDARTIYKRQKREVDAACKAFGVLSLTAFGSRARGEGSLEADLDLVLEVGDDLPRFLAAKEAIAKAFACPVDIIPLPTHRPRLMQEIKRDGVQLYP